jgi:mRNA interferase MazF
MNKWNIYRANLDPIIGSEQGKSRPVLIISDDTVNDVLRCVNIIPITTLKEGRKIYPNEVKINAKTAGLSNTSIILCHQIRTLDKTRLSHFYGQIDEDVLKNDITEALCFQLGL